MRKSSPLRRKYSSSGFSERKERRCPPTAAKGEGRPFSGGGEDSKDDLYYYERDYFSILFILETEKTEEY